MFKEPFTLDVIKTEPPEKDIVILLTISWIQKLKIYLNMTLLSLQKKLKSNYKKTSNIYDIEHTILEID